MFYRRKIILSLLQLSDGSLNKIALQKLLLLTSLRQQKPEYEFVPYRFGSYSFSAHADIVAMIGHGLISDETKSYQLQSKTDYFGTLSVNDKKIVTDVLETFGKMSEQALMKFTYTNYPYYAINSEAAPGLLNDVQLAAVKSAVPHSQDIILFTIGYEGVSLEAYLNKLVKNDIKVLVDVRRNPLSMKFGFSKTSLINYCNSLHIEYLHIPELGIESDKRKSLNTQQDYDNLFANYRNTNLSKTTTSQQRILELLKTKLHIALTCFEANICQCHRTHLAEAITKLPDWKYELKHI
ncbi:MAG: DUF488 family protein [Flavobacteriales bacterium]